MGVRPPRQVRGDVTRSSRIRYMPLIVLLNHSVRKSVKNLNCTATVQHVGTYTEAYIQL